MGRSWFLREVRRQTIIGWNVFLKRDMLDIDLQYFRMLPDLEIGPLQRLWGSNEVIKGNHDLIWLISYEKGKCFISRSQSLKHNSLIKLWLIRIITFLAVFDSRDKRNRKAVSKFLFSIEGFWPIYKVILKACITHLNLQTETQQYL